MNTRNAIFGLLLLTAAGCGVPKPIEGRMDPYPTPQVTFASQELAQYTTVGIPIMERKNGILYVTLPIRSTAIYDLRIDYRVTFLNAQGSPIYQGPWEGARKLVKNVQSEIQFNSPSGDAADFRIDLRYSE